MTLDFLAIGDTTIDAFIRLKDASVHCSVNKEGCELCMRFADKIPFEFVEEIAAVGNSANAAVAAARLGLTSALRAYVGSDENGEKCRRALEKEHVVTTYLEAQEGKKTNYHYVLWFEDERTILIKHENFKLSFPALAEAPRWIYLSSVGEGSEEYHAAIANFVASHPGTKLAFQPGTYQMKLGTEVLKDVYAHTEIFFCNKEEAQRILKRDTGDLKELLAGLRALGPRIVVITDGRNGACIETPEGTWSMPIYPDPAPPKERTGAGDATASTTVAYMALGMAPQEALLRGMINSTNVVQEIGAQKGLLTPAQIEEWFARRPANFVATPF
jgi:sugar/nucleoside kinase (ribokinase family)